MWVIMAGTIQPMGRGGKFKGSAVRQWGLGNGEPGIRSSKRKVEPIASNSKNEIQRMRWM